VKEFIDLSIPLESLGTPAWPGLPQPLRASFTSLKDSISQTNLWIFNEHTGTHMDSPAHFVEDGLTIERIALSRCVGNAAVLDFSSKPPKYGIGKADIKEALEQRGEESRIGQGWVLLFYTGYTSKMGTVEWGDYPGLTDEACSFIVQLGVNAIGADAPAVDREPYPAHKVLLPLGITIYENLTNLQKVLDRKFVFVGVPLPLVRGTASPVRAFAMTL
jgi:kynurenine formamidase